MNTVFQSLRRCPLPPLLLAGLIQIAPAVQWISQQITQPGGLIAIGAKIGGISAALLGGVHSVSGATTWVASTNPPAVKVGVAYTYRLQTAGAESAHSWSSTALPSGLAITGSDPNYFITGTPAAVGTNTVTLTAWEETGNRGASVSGNAIFVITNSAVGGVAPTIITPPRSQRRLPGTNVTFTVTAAGTAPLSYLWLRNGNPLVTATNSSWTLSNLTSASSSTCAVIVSNSFGSITSSVVNLLVAGRPTVTNSFVGPALRFTFNGETGVTYRVESSPTIDFTALTTVTNVTPVFDGTISVTNNPSAGTNTFFRLRLLSP